MRSYGIHVRRSAYGVIVAVIVVGSTIVKADFVVGNATNLGPPISSQDHDHDQCLSADGLLLIFCSDRAGGIGRFDLWATTRETKNDSWSYPQNLGARLNSVNSDADPSLSTDGLTLYFRSDRPGGLGSQGNQDIWVATRETVDDAWGEPVNLGQPVNSSYDESDPLISSDGLSLYFSEWGWTKSNRRPGGSGGSDIWVSTRPTQDAPWSEPINLSPAVNSVADDFMGDISDDGLIIFFSSDREGGFGSYDLYITKRTTTSDLWGDPVNLGPIVNSLVSDSNPKVSSDGTTLYFDSTRPGHPDLYQAPILPTVDFNTDGKVDGSDVLTMANFWGTDDSLCDVGPTPWGDGVVDVEDLKVLAEYIGQDVFDGSLIAHWTLNETEGDIAYDNSSENDALVQGGATWQPEAGIIDGALALDGVDDYIETPLIAGLRQGSFSVFAWIRGGGADQVIISVETDSDWLLGSMKGRTGVGGKLATIFGGTTLTSETMIADDQWHRLGLVYDGENRTLYVDDVAVAEDGATDTRPGSFGLNIGCGADKTPGTFFSGLIDDVRIYNRAVRP